MTSLRSNTPDSDEPNPSNLGNFQNRDICSVRLMPHFVKLIENISENPLPG